MTVDIIERAQARIIANTTEIDRLMADNARWQDFLAQAQELAGVSVSQPEQTDATPSGDAQFRDPDDWEDEDDAQPALQSPEPVTLIDPIVGASPKGGRPETVRSKIVACHKEHPDWPSKLIADHLGISEDQVRATASRKGLKIVTWWDYQRAQKAATTKALEQEVKPAVPAPQPVERAPAAVRQQVKQPSGTKLYLRDRATGHYLHTSLTVGSDGKPLLTSNSVYAWKGSEAQLLAVRTKLPQAQDMRDEVVIS